MKILVMGFTKIKYMPYMNFYLENIDRDSNDVHVLYWNRDLQLENVSSLGGVTLHEFYRKQDDDVAKISKIGSFIRYSRYVRKVICQEKFDFIIVLHSLPGVLIQDVLLKKYKGRFIFDYRDSTYESIPPFKKLVGRLVEASCVTFVSSDAFRRFLPEECEKKIFTSHNLLMDSLKHRAEKAKYGTNSGKIRIAFWGFIRHEEINREIIKKIALDSRFELHYYGREQQVALNLKTYVKEICAKNVFFHGEYKPEDRYEFVQNTDIIHNIYKDANTMLAMGNKYYDGLIFKIPQLCMKGSFMGERASNAKIGLECSPYSERFLDDVQAYIEDLDYEEFCDNCEKELVKILKEIEKGVSAIRTVVLQQKR